MKERKVTYIGDSVYATNDGWHVIIYTDNGEGAQNQIYLDAGVFQQLIDYAVSIGFTPKVPAKIEGRAE